MGAGILKLMDSVEKWTYIRGQY